MLRSNLRKNWGFRGASSSMSMSMSMSALTSTAAAFFFCSVLLLRVPPSFYADGYQAHCSFVHDRRIGRGSPPTILPPFPFPPSRRPSSSPTSRKFSFDDYEYSLYGYDEGDRGLDASSVDLSYLSIDEHLLPPLTRDVLRDATLNYVCDGGSIDSESCEVAFGRGGGGAGIVVGAAERPPPCAEDVLDAVEAEFDYAPVPFAVGNATFVDDAALSRKGRKGGGGDGGGSGGRSEAESASKILSFAAMHGVPKDIACYLLQLRITDEGDVRSDTGDEGSDENDDDDDDDAASLEECARQFEEGGWEAVSFPRGLSLRLRRPFYTEPADGAIGDADAAATRGGYFPPRRRRRLLLPTLGRRSREAAAEEATYARRALERAASARPPERRFSRAELLAALDEAIGGAAGGIKAAEALSEQSPERAVVGEFKFFPEREERARLWKETVRKVAKVKRKANGATQGLTDRLAGLGKGGLLSYGFLNFSWYTLAIGWQWTQFASPIPQGTAAAIGLSVRKFGRVFLSAYVGSQVTKLPRLWAALILAPAGNRVLRSVERRLNVNEKTAFGIVTGLLIGGCLGIWAALIFGDALVSSAGTFSM